MVKASPIKETIRPATAAIYRTANINVIPRCNDVGVKSSKKNCEIKKIKEKQELKTLYKKLREVIPSCQQRPLTGLDIVLKAVDYINELHQMLNETIPDDNKDDVRKQLLQATNKTLAKPSFRDVTNMECNNSNSRTRE
uniref:BHLH domain-containing protein n=1 Tax=Ciona intestinalis TaxID=7719 RepID=F7AVQ0_CIOIN